MGREFKRTDRLAEQIQRELASLLLMEVNDPSLRGLVIADVEVTRDLAHAKVYVTVPRGVEDKTPVDPFPALERASGFLRRSLASRMRVRAVPQLHFEQDKTLDEAERIEHLLAEKRPPS